MTIVQICLLYNVAVQHIKHNTTGILLTKQCIKFVEQWTCTVACTLHCSGGFFFFGWAKNFLELGKGIFSSLALASLSFVLFFKSKNWFQKLPSHIFFDVTQVLLVIISQQTNIKCIFLFIVSWPILIYCFSKAIHMSTLLENMEILFAHHRNNIQCLQQQLFLRELQTVGGCVIRF